MYEPKMGRPRSEPTIVLRLKKSEIARLVKLLNESELRDKLCYYLEKVNHENNN